MTPIPARIRTNPSTSARPSDSLSSSAPEARPTTGVARNPVPDACAPSERVIAWLAQNPSAVANGPLYSRIPMVIGSQRIARPGSRTSASTTSGTSAISSIHGWSSSGDCVQRWRRTWIVTAAQITALSSSPKVPSSSPTDCQSMTAGLSSAASPPIPSTRPTSSLRRGRTRNTTASSSATHRGIVYSSTDDRPADTTWSASTWIATPAPI